VVDSSTKVTKTFTNTKREFGKEFTNPMVFVSGHDPEWVPLADWQDEFGIHGAEWVPVGEIIRWTVTYYVPGPTESGVTWTDVVLRDRFGAELDLYDPDNAMYMLDGSPWPIDPAIIGGGNLNKDPITDGQGVGFYHSKAKKMPQLRFIWEIQGNLEQGDMATLSFDVVTRLNPADHQEYTSCGLHILNSGANLKWKVVDGAQGSMSTPRL